jgi:EAL domain-containing protein (putative c-di-GMP-specific phosphodiesterase class I)
MGAPAVILPAFDLPAAALGDELMRDPAIDRLLGTARRHLGLEMAFVSRYVEDGQRELTHISSDLALPMGPGFREPREDSYCWHILHGRLPELIQDPADFPLTQSLAITAFLPVGCHVSTPLRLSDGTVWGSFGAIGRTPDRSLTSRDVAILRSFAGLASERIESALEAGIVREQARVRVEAMLDGHAVTMFQQPIHALDTGKPVGVECLARFPDINKRGPDAWFQDAELVGLGTQLEMTAVRCALESIGQVPQGIYAAINASPKTILSGDLRRALESIEHSAELVIEVTEHEHVDDYAALAKELATIRPFARIAIDDVGAGYAGLRHVVDLQPDILKMAMVLTRNIQDDPARRAMTSAMVHFARDIGCKLVAEGIETEAERDVMERLGVDYGQGYLFARPLPAIAAHQHLLGFAGRR